MDTRDGKIVDYKDIPKGEEEHYVEIKRDLTLKEKNNKQIRLYSPCGCGSGKNFKFCCYKK
jgi:uncharacterized protein YchJ